MNINFNPANTIKQTIMNKIGLPYDVMNIIKEFTFYDKKEAQQMIKHNNHMKQIVDTISSADTRVTLNISDDDEQWAFGFVDEELYNRNPIQLQGVNCKHCGEYTHNIVTPNIFCDGFCRQSL